MESSWAKVRQVVANRVLTRHLQDLHEQQVAMETAQSQQAARQGEREVRASRNRAASLYIDSTDPLVPVTSRRRSMPLSPRLLPTTTTTTTSSVSRPPTRRRVACAGAADLSGDGGSAAPGDGGGVDGRRGTSLDPERTGGRISSDTHHQQHEQQEERNTDNLLELMASTLQTARTTEQQRPHLHHHSTQPSLLGGGKALSSSAQTMEPGPAPATASLTHRPPLAATSSSSSFSSSSFSKSQRATRGAPGPANDEDSSQRPRLERGETFLQMDQSQVLSLEGASPSPTQEEKEEGNSGNPHGSRGSGEEVSGKARRRARQRKGRKGVGTVTSDATGHDYANSGAALPRSCEGSVNVDFYDEDTGLKKDDGGFTPKDLTLSLNMLQEDDGEELAQIGDGEGEEEEEEGAEREGDEEDAAGEEEDDPWSEVKKCQYIRGYDPPHMRMPQDTVKFVFGNNR